VDPTVSGSEAPRERVSNTEGAPWILSLLAILAALYFGKGVLIPIALSFVLTFLLVPLVSRIEQRLRLPRVIAVVTVVALLGAGIGLASWVLGAQIAELSSHGPEYRQNLSVKLRTLRAPLGAIGRAVGVMDDLEQALDPAHRLGVATTPVEVVEAAKPVKTVVSLLGPVLAPFATAGIVAILSLFMLIQREDLRDRVVRLAGPSRVALVTHAIDDITARLGRYLGMMCLLCALYGASVSIGLALLGVPGALLWGAVSGTLRFVPYVGPWLSATMAVLLTLATFPGWMPAVLAVALFIGLELVLNNVLEPWLYGTSAGLSPIAIILSALFWTWIWGLPGLFLATPLTVCLVVAGRYVAPLGFLPILLGDGPQLSPELRLYQRMLAMDLDESTALLQAVAAAPRGRHAASRLLRACRLRLEYDLRRGVLASDRADAIRRLADDVEEAVSGGAAVRGATLATASSSTSMHDS
jgi:predicted PurR-regulated permease PerM